jgi:ubiquinone/menaquinone biosynthesis C-methylase UbiE
VNDQIAAYHSESNKSATEASLYSKTHQSTHRYLAYRDIPALINSYIHDIHGKEALDDGTGTGCSAQFLSEQGFNVTGVDCSEEMLFQAKKNYPELSFHQVQNQDIPLASDSFDFVFSSFVLFEMGTENEIITYLTEAKRVLKAGGIFIAVTGSQDLHSSSKDWMNFGTNFPENRDPKSGDVVKLYLHDPGIEFTDYYWTESDYRQFFLKAGFQIKEVHYPLGKRDEPYQWRDEKNNSPFVIFVARK